MSPEALDRAAAAVQLIVFDVDGVLTDGRITYTSAGDEVKSFHVQDGAALKMLMREGIEVAIITGRQSVMVERRAGELGIQHLFQGNEDKIIAFQTLCERVGVPETACAHVGDDLPDIALFERVGLSISVPNGHPSARAAADWVTDTAGGEGVAREICERLLRARGAWSWS